MATADLNDVLNVPGRLSWNPTSVTTAYPHGGTALGSTRGIFARPLQTFTEIRDEAFGSEVSNIVWSGDNLVLACVFRSYDADAMATIFPNTATGSVAKRKVISSPGSNRPGLLLGDLAGKLLFTPLAFDYAPSFLLYRAAPMPEETMNLGLAFNTRLEYPAMFTALRDSSDRRWKIGLLRDLTLP